jgi:hypothetical protein
MPDDVHSSGPVTRRERTPTKGDSWNRVLGIAGNLGYMIAVPAVLFIVGGAYADKWFGTSPILVLTGIPLAFIVSGFSVFRLIKQVQAEDRKEP